MTGMTLEQIKISYKINLQAAKYLCELADELEQIPPNLYEQDTWGDYHDDPSRYDRCPACAAGWAVRMEIDGLDREHDQAHRVAGELGITSHHVGQYIFGASSDIFDFAYVAGLPTKRKTAKDAVTRIEAILDLNGFVRVDK